MRRLVVAALMTFLLIMCFADRALVQEPLRVTCKWRVATEGSPAILYQLHIQDIDGGLDTTYVVPAQPGDTQEFHFVHGEYLRRYVARVRGVDVDGDEGPWSEWSEVASFEISDPRRP
jgi:hypothetical protein